MMYLAISFSVPLTTAQDFYLPVPKRGIVKGAKAVYSEETNTDETIDLLRDTTSVCLVTPPATSTAEGVEIDGVPDTTNKDLVFDPDSDTAAYKRIKISTPNTFNTAGIAGLIIEYDPYVIEVEDPALA